MHCEALGVIPRVGVRLHWSVCVQVFRFLKETFDEMRDTRRVLKTAGDWAMHRDSIGL